MKPGMLSINSPLREKGLASSSLALVWPFDAEVAMPMRLSALPSMTISGISNGNSSASEPTPSGVFIPDSALPINGSKAMLRKTLEKRKSGMKQDKGWLIWDDLPPWFP